MLIFRVFFPHTHTHPKTHIQSHTHTHTTKLYKMQQKKYDNYKGGNQPWSRNNGPSQDNHKPHFL